MKPILMVLRPVETAEAFASKVTERVGGPVTVITSPAIKISPMEPEGPRRAEHLIFTSANGVRYAAQFGFQSNQCVFCVGDRTSEIATAHGYDAVKAGNNASELIAKVISLRPNGSLLHVSGQHTRGAIVAHLQDSKLNAHQVVTYAQTLQELTDEAKSAFAGRQPIILPVFSPRTASVLSAVVPSALVMSFAMSAAVKEAMPLSLHNTCEVVGTSDEDSMANATVAALQEAIDKPD